MSELDNSEDHPQEEGKGLTGKVLFEGVNPDLLRATAPRPANGKESPSNPKISKKVPESTFEEVVLSTRHRITGGPGNEDSYRHRGSLKLIVCWQACRYHPA